MLLQTDNQVTRLAALFLAVFALLLSGCATPQNFTPESAPEYVIVRAYTPFYKLGPMQGGGPDASLPVDTRFKVIRQEMGYSYIMLEDKRTGYIANENMAPAPPRPPAPPAGALDDDRGSASSRRKHGGSTPNSPRYNGEQVNDTPLPAGPPPDLNIAPEVVPDAPTQAPAPPAEKPKFRY